MKYQTELKWAMILFLFTLMWKVFEKMMGWHGLRIEQHALYSNIYDVFFVAVFVFALLDKRQKSYAGKMTWAQGFRSGLMITLLITAVSPLTQFLSHRVISPDFFPNIINFAVENGALTREKAEAHFNLNNYIFQNFIGTAMLGFSCSVILPVFVRKKIR